MILNLEKPFSAMLRRFFEGVLEVLGFFTGGLKVFFLIIEGVKDAASSEVLFRGCQHGVCERLSLRGAVKFALRPTISFPFIYYHKIPSP